MFVVCGSFSPITYFHLRLFGIYLLNNRIEITISLEMARDRATDLGYDVIGGYMSPVSDAYKKKVRIGTQESHLRNEIRRALHQRNTELKCVNLRLTLVTGLWLIRGNHCNQNIRQLW